MVLGLPDPHPDPSVRGTDPRIRIRFEMSRLPNTFKYFVTWKRGNIAVLMRIKYIQCTVHCWNINLIRNGQNALIEYQTLMLRLAMLSNKGDISCNKNKYRIPCMLLQSPCTPHPHHHELILPSWSHDGMYARPLPLCILSAIPYRPATNPFLSYSVYLSTEPVFLNVYGAQ